MRPTASRRDLGSLPSINDKSAGAVRLAFASMSVDGVRWRDSGVARWTSDRTDRYGLGCGPVKAEQQGFWDGVKLMNSTRTSSGSKTFN